MILKLAEQLQNEQLMRTEQMVRQAYGNLPTLDEYIRKDVLPLKRNLLAQMQYYIDRKKMRSRLRVPKGPIPRAAGPLWRT